MSLFDQKIDLQLAMSRAIQVCSHTSSQGFLNETKALVGRQYQEGKGGRRVMRAWAAPQFYTGLINERPDEV
jgi:hypothetical protein